MTSDYREMVIAELADSESHLLARLASAEAERDAYRELMCAAFDALREVTVLRDHERALHRQLQDEYRVFRERVIISAGAHGNEAA